MRETASPTVLPAVTALAVVSAFAAGCAPSAETAGRRVTDLAGREVAVPREVHRLVALGPGALRLVVYLGVTDRLVGIEDIENRMVRDVYVRPYASGLGEDVLDLPVVSAGGPGVLPDPERLLACRPDLLVCVGIDPAGLENLEAKTGVPALYLSYGELGVWGEEARRSLTLLGDVLGRAARAEALNQTIAALERDLAARTADIPATDRPTVYIGGISYKGPHGLTSTEAGYPPARLVGARNLADTVRAGALLRGPGADSPLGPGVPVRRPRQPRHPGAGLPGPPGVLPPAEGRRFRPDPVAAAVQPL